MCTRCHHDRRLVGTLSLEDFDVAAADQAPEIAERMVRKLRAGMMLPPGVRRPAGDTLLNLVETLEGVLDAAPGEWLSLDQMSANFDNIADKQALSPTLVESYLNAAAEISRWAVGDLGGPGVQEIGLRLPAPLGPVLGSVRNDLPTEMRDDFPDDLLNVPDDDLRADLVAASVLADSLRALEPDPSGLRHVPDGWLPAVRYLVGELGVDVNARDHNGYNSHRCLIC